MVKIFYLPGRLSCTLDKYAAFLEKGRGSGKGKNSFLGKRSFSLPREQITLVGIEYYLKDELYEKCQNFVCIGLCADPSFCTRYAG